MTSTSKHRAPKPAEQSREGQAERPFTGTDKPWKEPGQSSQDDNEKPRTKIDLEKWHKSETH
jgi:hypothetical protein